MAGSTGRRRPRIPVGMAFQTTRLQVRPRERESCLVVVKSILGTARRMAGQTGRIFIHIAPHTRMAVIGLRIQVADNTRKLAVIFSIGVTLRALIPGTGMRSAVNGKMLLIVFRKTGRLPARIRRVTTGAVIRKTGSDVIGISRSNKISHVTGKTVGRSHIERPAAVAAGAILQLVSFGKGEKIVVDGLRRPVDRSGVVAVGTVGRKTGIAVARIGRGHEISPVAIDAGIANAVEFKPGFRDMTFITVGRSVRPQQRKPVVGMQFSNIIHQPATAVVTPAAVITHGIAVHIRMATDTAVFRFRKHQRPMAIPAVGRRMLTIQRKARLIVRKHLLNTLSRRQSCNPAAFSFWRLLLPESSRNLPTVRCVAYSTVQLQTLPVRVLSVSTTIR